VSFETRKKVTASRQDITGSAEVDFVILGKDTLPVEARYRSFKRLKIPSGLRSFIKRYRPKTACVITKDIFSQTVLNDTRILFVPAWAM